MQKVNLRTVESGAHNASPNEIAVRLPEETVNYLQRLDYELGGLQVLHTHALNAGTPLEKRMEIKREFQEIFAEYQMAKDEMWAEFAPRFPQCKRWWVDFQAGELHIEETSGTGAPLSPPEAVTPPFNKGGTANCPPDNLPVDAAEVGGHA